MVFCPFDLIWNASAPNSLLLSVEILRQENDSRSSQTNSQKTQRLLGRWLNRSFFSCSPDQDLLEMN